MFIAELNDDGHKLIWTKSIMAIALFSESIKFKIEPSQIIISGVNQTTTNQGEVLFPLSFFKIFELHGYPEVSFIVNSQHLSILFKNFDITSFLTFKIKSNTNFKLLIDIKNKLIIKKYQINYQPVKDNDNVIEDYAELFAQQRPQPQESDIKYMMMESSILKNFVDMIPLTTEEFKIDINNGKIQFNGFTKQILKDNNYLKQPMTITISISVNDLINTNINNNFNITLNFKLKFLRIFLNLVNLIKTNDNDNFEFFFKKNGDPIMLVSNNSNIMIKFFSLTNDEGNLGLNYQLETPQRSLETEIEQQGQESPHYSDNRESRDIFIKSQEADTDEIDQLNINFADDEEFGPTQDPIKSIFDGI